MVRIFFHLGKYCFNDLKFSKKNNNSFWNNECFTLNGSLGLGFKYLFTRTSGHFFKA